MPQFTGNAIVGQSGGPTAAINATLAGLIQYVRSTPTVESGIQTLYGMRNGIEGFLKENVLSLSDAFPATPDGDAALDRLVHTPGAALGSCRKKLPNPDEAENAGFFDTLLSLFKKYDIKYFFYIGGNDSMDTVAKLSRYTRKVGYPLNVLGLPKTIDNDLALTDHTPGFGSAAKYISTVLKETAIDCAVYGMKAVTVVEIMGRDAGWLTASAGLCSLTGGPAPDYIYLPEIPFSLEQFKEDIASAFEKHPNVVIAVSEGVRLADGTYVCEGVSPGGAKTDVFGHKQLSGTARALAAYVQETFGCKTRAVEINLPQRCASHIASKTDIDESFALGEAGGRYASQGRTNVMLILRRVSDQPYRYEIDAADVQTIANQVKAVPRDFINERGNGVTDACLKYLLPLIAGESYPTYTNGLPDFYTFD